MRQILIIGILACYVTAMISEPVVPKALTVALNNTNHTKLTNQTNYTSITKQNYMSRSIQCVADLNTSCSTNYTTSCLFLQQQNKTVCEIDTTFESKIDNGQNQLIHSVNKSQSASRIYAGNQTINSTSQIIQSVCTEVKINNLNSMSCSTNVTDCVNIYSPNSFCVTKSSVFMTDQQAIHAAKLQSDNCIKQSKVVSTAQQIRDNLCEKLNELFNFKQFKQFRRDCVSATNKWYSNIQKRAELCMNLVPVI